MGKQYQQLVAEERAVIFVMKSAGSTMTAIARELGRSPSTISRELRRNGYRTPDQYTPISRPLLAGSYHPVAAGARAKRLRFKRRRYPKLWRDGGLWWTVVGRIRRRWSPTQIARTLGCVSHETIYTAIYAMPRGELRREIIALMRQGKAARRPRSRGADRRKGPLKDTVSIHLRPPEANDRLLPGHWEGDFLKGGYNRSAVGTLVDRKSLFTMLAKMDGCTAEAALEGFNAAFAPLPQELRKTLTYDNGSEMAHHAKLAEGLGMKIYFADPYSPWQRGINENTNGLLRQYMPKGADLSKLTQPQLDAIAWELNTRPRATLGWRTPAEVFFENYTNPFQRPSVPPIALGA